MKYFHVKILNVKISCLDVEMKYFHVKILNVKIPD